MDGLDNWTVRQIDPQYLYNTIIMDGLQAVGMIFQTGLLVVLYLRVSTRIQARDGCGLEIQHANLERYACENKLNVVRVISDVGSAFQRDNLGGLSAYLDEHFLVRGILVASFDRFSRNLDRAQSFLDRHAAVTVYSLREGTSTATPCGRSAFRISILQAQLESERLSQTMKETIAHHRAQEKLCLLKF